MIYVVTYQVQVQTSGVVGAHVIDTVINVLLTCHAGVTWVTQAVEPVHHCNGNDMSITRNTTRIRNTQNIRNNTNIRAIKNTTNNTAEKTPLLDACVVDVL